MSSSASPLVWLGKITFFVGLFLLLAFLGGLAARLAGATLGAALTPAGVAVLVFAGVAASWVLTRRVEGRPLGSLGLRTGREGLGDLAGGTGAGIVIIGAVVLAQALLGWVTWRPAADAGSPYVAAIAIGTLLLGAAFVEELLFRGYPFQVLWRRFGPTAAIASTSLAFALLHGANPNVGPLGLGNIALAGILLGVAYERTGSLWFVTGVHLGWNWTMAVSELSVSGIEIEMPAYDPSVAGPGIWTGGDFGPEGGLLVTLASLAGIAWMWRLSPRDVRLSALEDHESEATVDAPMRSNETSG
ncbi:MAG: CPBP family intramembrane glutamic endopeptidase [Gemmatimonadota bacterium]|nr:CPBP family intramembrane glutamic endopeptidase [Gemmatimonadota bacterium]